MPQADSCETSEDKAPMGSVIYAMKMMPYMPSKNPWELEAYSHDPPDNHARTFLISLN